jgi:hypothetical protein
MYMGIKFNKDIVKQNIDLIFFFNLEEDNWFLMMILEVQPWAKWNLPECLNYFYNCFFILGHINPLH